MFLPCKLLAALVGVLWLASTVSCVRLEEPPHPMMGYIYDAKLLWSSVTNSKMLPGIPHVLNEERGVTPRWKDFLRLHGAETMQTAVEELRRKTIQADQRDYRIRKRIWNFVKPTNKDALLVVSEPAEQFVARKMVNAFADHWYRIYKAERDAEQAALEQEEREASETSSG
ncbi:conserved hypothetical protein [Sporisorium reilianum SRZ2]|uniref:Uncharacterized protein n=2 Tax=Sporisorium reilianum TaxID=72558 RepID=E7A0A8_SPORE|nr:conserved hypothetical protein [Sporisorium reilianum SRZ2]SJX62750.1 uncharacterized protein SRS1_11009 [Sporisorium reilianum f. sp. reilianum]